METRSNPDGDSSVSKDQIRKDHNRYEFLKFDESSNNFVTDYYMNSEIVNGEEDYFLYTYNPSFPTLHEHYPDYPEIGWIRRECGDFTNVNTRFEIITGVKDYLKAIIVDETTHGGNWSYADGVFTNVEKESAGHIETITKVTISNDFFTSVTSEVLYDSIRSSFVTIVPSEMNAVEVILPEVNPISDLFIEYQRIGKKQYELNSFTVNVDYVYNSNFHQQTSYSVKVIQMEDKTIIYKPNGEGNDPIIVLKDSSSGQTKYYEVRNNSWDSITESEYHRSENAPLYGKELLTPDLENFFIMVNTLNVNEPGHMKFYSEYNSHNSLADYELTYTDDYVLQNFTLTGYFMVGDDLCHDTLSKTIVDVNNTTFDYPELP